MVAMHARAAGCNYIACEDPMRWMRTRDRRRATDITQHHGRKLVEHVLTTFKNFPVETLSDMRRTKSRVLKAIVARDGGDDYAIPWSNTD